MQLTRHQIDAIAHKVDLLKEPVRAWSKEEARSSARLFDPELVALFGDPTRLRVRAGVDERVVAGLKIGQKATVFGRGLGARQHCGRVVLIKSIMGKKTVFSRSASERKDLDVIQVMVEMDQGFAAPIGLEVDVTVFGHF